MKCVVCGRLGSPGICGEIILSPRPGTLGTWGEAVGADLGYSLLWATRASLTLPRGEEAWERGRGCLGASPDRQGPGCRDKAGLSGEGPPALSALQARGVASTPGAGWGTGRPCPPQSQLATSPAPLRKGDGKLLMSPER